MIVGRPRVDKGLEDWVVKMAEESRGWGYDHIAGALAELGYNISDQTWVTSSCSARSHFATSCLNIWRMITKRDVIKGWAM